MRASALFVLLILTAATASAHTLVYRVDRATAVIEGNRLVVTARGAVRSGGWDKPRLIIRKGPRGSADLEVAFVASPPQDPATVIQSLLPVSVSLKTHLPKSGVAAVRVVSETNTVTAEIIPKQDREKTASR